MTYSIVARDPSTGELGAAIQSHYFSVAIAVRAEAGVGAVASQSFHDPSYFAGLDLMRAGVPAPDALRALTSVEPGETRRQVAFVDADGRTGAHTGAMCIPAAGHVTGDGVSAQANMMRRDTVWDAMLGAYVSTSGELADRLLAALDAAEAEGGDIRGRQSAAIIVVKGASSGKPWADRVLDLRVEDHPEPLTELRRLVTVKRAYDRMNRAEELVTSGDIDAARAEFEAAAAAAPGNVEFAFFHAVALAAAGRMDQAREAIDVARRDHDGWIELVRRLPAAGLLTEELAAELVR